MLLKEKTKNIIWRMAGVSLGALLVAVGASLGPGLSPFAPSPEIALAAPADGACRAVWDAAAKAFAMPHHTYYVYTGPEGKPVTVETIYVDGAVYAPVKGQWFRIPESVDGVKELMEQNRKNATNVSCHMVRDESVNGESATLYSVHAETPRGIDDSQIWVSKSTKVLLREETDVVLAGRNEKKHSSTRFDYNNVQTPKL
jgi:phage major head subunit gpT-like protein